MARNMNWALDPRPQRTRKIASVAPATDASNTVDSQLKKEE